MSQELVMPILHSVKHVLQTMALVDSQPGASFTKAKSEPLTGDVTGVIGWTGVMKGCLTISFSEGAILSIVSSMFGEPCTQINQDVQDAVGELSNMISGDARRALESQGYVFRGSLPTVVVGRGLRITHMIKRPSIVTPFTVDGNHTLCVETCFEDESSARG